VAIPHAVRRGVVAVLLLVAFVLQGTTSVLAGTTGAITGSVIDPTSNQPVSGARVTVASPSQSATTTTDASGRFSFISLNPDTYTVSVAATSARDAASVSGVTVQADQTVTVSLQQPTRLKQIGSVTSRAASALVKPGTTADVYSINAVTQDKASALGGGGTLNQAWSAISSVPGVYVAPNQQGYIGAGPTLSIRGGDYDQIGYELDGVPVNRAFDNYPSGPLSSLGQQELQVYTGAPAANAEANGISGYINQVIRTGTAPASRNLTLAIGTPTFYNKVAFEAGGANPARTFSYYLGAGAYNQSYRYYDNFNGASLQPLWGAPLAPCPIGPGATGISRGQAPSCFTANGTPYTTTYSSAAGGCTGYICSFVLGPYTLQAFLSDVKVRDTVANFHFGIPRKDGNRDDVQLLFDNNFISNPYYSSTNDQGGIQYLSDISEGFNSALPPGYFDGFQSSLKAGAVLPTTFTGGNVSPYLFPQSPNGRQFLGFANCSAANPTTVSGGCIEPDRRDTFNNNQSILKLQYQKNFGTNAFLRLYGYTYYSDWLQTGPQTNNFNYIGYVPGDYELESHTRGVSLQFADQINTQHLLGFTASYTTATTLRDNNTQFLDNGGTSTFRNTLGILVNGNDPYSGICYSRAGAAVPCYRADGARWNPSAGFFTYSNAFANAVNNGTTRPAPAATCGTGPCEWLIVGNGGLYATYNTVTPKFAAVSLTDQWKPSDRLSFDLGLRFDSFVFQGSDTTTGGQARVFAYNAWNRQFPALKQFNVSGQVESYSELEPRLGATYSLDPRTVLRASYGRYAQAPNSAFEQYNFLSPAAPALLVGFVNKGVGNTPAHAIRPSVANNYDFSLEHQFNRDTSVKLTPFLRKTQDQIQQFYLDQKTNFVSGLNVGRQTSQGVEFELDKGDFSRNGWAGRLTYTYTNSYIQYARENGLSVLDPFNTAISNYNTYTKAGGGAPCYTTGGAADPTCGAGSIANPYYNAPLQPLFDQNGKYATFSLFPAGIGGAGVTTYGAPHVATLLVQYKHGPLSITPALQFSGGIRYGVPLGNPGIVPDTCTGALGTTTSGDPRYPYGAAGGLPYDAAACGTTFHPGGTGANENLQFAIPNVYTGRFDNLGAFAAPNNIQLHTQVTWDINKRVTLVGNFANIVNRCFGGSKVGWSVPQACGYAVTYGATFGPTPVGNVFNPGDVVQPFQRAPYDPAFAGFPFNMYFEARIKI
jgi:TonB dependent receptor/Carboxypeptidase regulatory-like domain/TonB-dependent Receptor Plug Domain